VPDRDALAGRKRLRPVEANPYRPICDGLGRVRFPVNVAVDNDIKPPERLHDIWLVEIGIERVESEMFQVGGDLAL
jgi:hypothetical protein